MLKETLDTISETGENRDFFSMPLKEYKRMMNYKDDIPTKQIREDLKVLMTKIVEWDLDKTVYGVASVMLASFELKRELDD